MRLPHLPAVPLLRDLATGVARPDRPLAGRAARIFVTPLTLLIVATTAACGSDEPAVASPFAECSAVTAPPPSAAPASAASTSATSAAPTSATSAAPTSATSAATASVVSARADLPDLELPCFTGDDRVSLRELRGPAVINIWASWCGPCRTELPVMQSLADQADGRLTVLGVDSGDKRDSGAAFAADKGVRMPTLFDEKGTLLNGLGRVNLPVTVFLDSAGQSYVHILPLDARGLSEQVRKHTGVTMTVTP